MKNKYLKLTSLSERRFRAFLRLFAADIPALKTARLTGLSYVTAHRLYTLLRGRIVGLACAEARAFSGEIEVDESYFGARRVRGKRGRGAGGKLPVLGVHKRGDRVFLSVVRNCSKEELMPVLRGRITRQSDVHSDGWKACDGVVSDGYRHHRVFHHENEFARGRNRVNGIESFWSFAKSRLAQFKGIRRDRFLVHLKECEWRFNHRRDNINKILLRECRLKPLSTI